METLSDAPSAVRGTPETGVAGRRRLPTEQSPDDALATGLAAFDTLLEATRNGFANTVRYGRFDRTLPSQMFEPQVNAGHGYRLNGLKREFRSALLNEQAEGRMNPASVEARAADRNGRADGPGNTGALDRAAISEPSNGIGKTTSTTDALTVPATAKSGGPEGGRPGQFPIRPTEVNAVPRASLLEGENLIRIGRDAAGMSANALASGRVPGGASTSSGADQTHRVARQVGQLLGAARSGSVESLRAANASPATGDPPSPTSQQKPASPEQLGRHGHTELTASKAGQDGPAPSRFDELVRSIRLQTGARHSSARMHLEPPELGRMRVDVRMNGDRVQIDIRTETTKATELLHHRTAGLKAALEMHGIFVERFDVTSDLAEPTGRGVGFSVGGDEGASQNESGGSATAAGPSTDDPPIEVDESEMVEGDSRPLAADTRRLDIRI